MMITCCWGVFSELFLRNRRRCCRAGVNTIGGVVVELHSADGEPSTEHLRRFKARGCRFVAVRDTEFATLRTVGCSTINRHGLSLTCEVESQTSSWGDSDLRRMCGTWPDSPGALWGAGGRPTVECAGAGGSQCVAQRGHPVPTCALGVDRCRRRHALPEPLRPESESEADDNPEQCEAGSIHWQSHSGRVSLSACGGCVEAPAAHLTALLSDDAIGGRNGRTMARLCMHHAHQCVLERASQRCA
eukprot:915271-Amphidinium_carterae.5